MTPSELGISNL